jgi:hypothetical protein
LVAFSDTTLFDAPSTMLVESRVRDIAQLFYAVPHGDAWRVIGSSGMVMAYSTIREEADKLVPRLNALSAVIAECEAVLALDPDNEAARRRWTEYGQELDYLIPENPDPPLVAYSGPDGKLIWKD